MSRFDHRLEAGLGRIADRATPSPDAWEGVQTRIVQQASQPEMEIIMLQKNEPPPRRVAPWVLGAAAAVIVAMIAVFALTRSDDEGSTVFTDGAGREDPAVDAGVVVALEFIDARAVYDGERVRALVADDAVIVIDDEFIDNPDDYPFLSRYEQVLGMEFLDPVCTEGSPGRVSCTYTMASDMTRALGVDPVPHGLLLEIADGLITAVNHDRLPSPMTQEDDVYKRGFNVWLGENHPEDFDQIGGSNFALTAETIDLVEIRIAEYIVVLEAS